MHGNVIPLTLQLEFKLFYINLALTPYKCKYQIKNIESFLI